MWPSRLQRVGAFLRPVTQQAGSSSLTAFPRAAAAFSSTSLAKEDSPSSFGPASSSNPLFSDTSFQLNRPRLKGYNSRAPPCNLHVKASRNNTMLTLTTPEGQPITRVSSGMCGFKKTGRSGYEAGHQSSIRMFNLIKENQFPWGIANLAIVFNGFGTGREAFYRALMTDAGMPVRNLVRKFVDATRIRVGGCRPKKRRML